MSITRRDFLKLSGTILSASLVTGISTITNNKYNSKLRGSKKITTICPLCSIGCNVDIYYKKNKILQVRGDVNSPINEGTLCQKGKALSQLLQNKNRLDKIKYRPPYSNEWQTISWSKAIEKIAIRIKKTRDASFLDKENNNVVNRTEGIISIAGSNITNEEAYLFNKFSRILGIPNVTSEPNLKKNQVSSALSETLGLDTMTNPFSDIKNANLVLIIGFDPAKSYPIVFKHMIDARKKGAEIITVDPRITRSAISSDLHCQIKPGTDIAFINGLINYALQNNKVNKSYISEYTDASFLVDDKFNFNSIDKLFSGYNPLTKSYTEKSSWKYKYDERGNPYRDEELLNKKSVFQLMKKHFSRYTIDRVSKITGITGEQFLKTAELITQTANQKKSLNVFWGGGITDQKSGNQAVRGLSILQLLLGNIGVSGGGLFSGKTEANEQGVYDQVGDWNFLPGKLPVPVIDNKQKDSDLHSYIRNNTVVSNDPMSINQWSNVNKYFVSFLKSWFGKSASSKNKYNFDLLPKINKKYDRDTFSREFLSGKKYSGALFLGADIVHSGINKNQVNNALSTLDWIVVSDIWGNDTASFWENNKLNSKSIKTEVFMLPTLSLSEKEGSLTNAERCVQWINGKSFQSKKIKTELQFLNSLFNKIKSLYSEKGGVFAEIFKKVNWKYNDGDITKQIAREISGTVNLAEKLTTDGSTKCGNWLYCGMYTQYKNNTERKNNDSKNMKISLYNKWGWSWPENIRFLYNRASVDRSGNPWNEEKWILKKGNVDFIGDIVHGKGDVENKNPFSLTREGVAHLWSPNTYNGPLPEYYEHEFDEKIKKNKILNDDYYYFASISNINESKISKNINWLQEIEPVLYCELSRKTAEKKNLVNGEEVTISSFYGEIKAKVLISTRFNKIKYNSKIDDFIYIFGYKGTEVLNNVFGNVKSVLVKIRKEGTI